MESVQADGGVRPDAAAADRVWTLPNALSVLRLLGVPLFLWLLLGPHADGWALAVLMVSGFTDWADGKLARKLDQTSRLGALLDPAADRLYILATLVGLVLRDVIPLWLALVIVGRDVVLGVVLLPCCAAAATRPPQVHYLGKAATLLPALRLPVLLLGDARRHARRHRRGRSPGRSPSGAPALYLLRRRRSTSSRSSAWCDDPAPAVTVTDRRAVRRARCGAAAARRSSWPTPSIPGYAGGGRRAARRRRRPARWYDAPGASLSAACSSGSPSLVVAYVHTHRGAPQAASGARPAGHAHRTAPSDTTQLADRSRLDDRAAR